MLYVLILVLFFKNGEISPNVTSYATEDICISIAHQIVEVANQDGKVTDVIWTCMENPTEALKKSST